MNVAGKKERERTCRAETDSKSTHRGLLLFAGNLLRRMKSGLTCRISMTLKGEREEQNFATALRMVVKVPADSKSLAFTLQQNSSVGNLKIHSWTGCEKSLNCFHLWSVIGISYSKYII